MTAPTIAVRELAAQALAESFTVGWFIRREDILASADAVLAAVIPALRRQVGEEIAQCFEARNVAVWPDDPNWPGMGENRRRHSWFAEAAAIARSHSREGS